MCNSCKDKMKFGGMGKKKQACIHKKCLQMQTGKVQLFMCANTDCKSTSETTGTVKARIQYFIVCCMQSQNGWSLHTVTSYMNTYRCQHSAI